jgi:hypothetical protein
MMSTADCKARLIKEYGGKWKRVRKYKDGGQILREFEDDGGCSMTVVSDATDTVIVEIVDTDDLDTSKTSKPSDYYFQLDMSEETIEGLGSPAFMITARKYYDKHKCLDDCCGAHNTPMPSDFGPEETEAVWSYDGDPQVGRASLLKAGFVEKHMVAGLDRLI